MDGRICVLLNKKNLRRIDQMVRWENMVNELFLKASIYNAFMRMNP